MSRLVRFDWAMKHLLRNKANFDILEGFLSELLKTSIKIEQILESESNKNHRDDKSNRVDVLVKTDSGDHIIVEVQCSTQFDYLSRILYGTSKVVCEYLHAGDSYRKIRKVISVSIVFFDLGAGKDYLYKGTIDFKGLHYHDTLQLNAAERKLYAQSGVIVPETPDQVFPEYYIIKVLAFHEKVKDKLDEWIYFLKHGQVEQHFAAQGLQSAARKLDVLSLTPEKRREYERYKESLHDNASYAETLEVSIEMAKKEKQFEIAKAMKREGMPLADIARFTQLSEEELDKLD